MAQISFDVQWIKELSRNLRLTAQKLDNLASFYKDAIDIVKQRSDDIFSTAWSNVEKWEKWRSLAPSTLRARTNRTGYYAKPPIWWNWPLIWTGNLKNNVIIQSSPKYWVLKYNEPYARYHQSWWWSLPRRKIIDIDNKTATKIIKSLQKTIQEQSPIFMKQL